MPKRKRRIHKKRAILVLAIGLCIFLIALCGGIWAIRSLINNFQTPAKDSSPSVAEAENAKTSGNQVTITATGDILLEEAILEWFGDGDWKGYMDRLAPWFSQDDLTIANLEVPIGGEELGITGIDFSFNAPAITAKNMKDQSIEFVSLANNHAMDRGTQGLINTHTNLDEQNIDYTGTFQSEQERDTACIIEVNGIKIGLVSFTYGTNQPVEASWQVNLLDMNDPSLLVEDIQSLQNQCDSMIAMMHWGTEFTYDLNATQEYISTLLANLGVDVIIGNHPHTIQPAMWLEGEDGHKTLCFYSMGNLASSAYTVSRANETFQNMYEVGAIAQFTLAKDSSGQVSVESPQIIPFVNHFEDEYQNFRLVPLKDYTEEEAASHDQRRFSDLFTVEWLKAQVHEVFDTSGMTLQID